MQSQLQSPDNCHSTSHSSTSSNDLHENDITTSTRPSMPCIDTSSSQPKHASDVGVPQSSQDQSEDQQVMELSLPKPPPPQDQPSTFKSNPYSHPLPPPISQTMSQISTASSYSTCIPMTMSLQKDYDYEEEEEEKEEGLKNRNSSNSNDLQNERNRYHNNATHGSSSPIQHHHVHNNIQQHNLNTQQDQHENNSQNYYRLYTDKTSQEQIQALEQALKIQIEKRMDLEWNLNYHHHHHHRTHTTTSTSAHTNRTGTTCTNINKRMMKMIVQSTKKHLFERLCEQMKRLINDTIHNNKNHHHRMSMNNCYNNNDSEVISTAASTTTKVTELDCDTNDNMSTTMIQSDMISTTQNDSEKIIIDDVENSTLSFDDNIHNDIPTTGHTSSSSIITAVVNSIHPIQKDTNNQEEQIQEFSDLLNDFISELDGLDGDESEETLERKDVLWFLKNELQWRFDCIKQFYFDDMDGFHLFMVKLVDVLQLYGGDNDGGNDDNHESRSGSCCQGLNERILNSVRNDLKDLLRNINEEDQSDDAYDQEFSNGDDNHGQYSSTYDTRPQTESSAIMNGADNLHYTKEVQDKEMTIAILQGEIEQLQESIKTKNVPILEPTTATNGLDYTNLEYSKLLEKHQRLETRHCKVMNDMQASIKNKNDEIQELKAIIKELEGVIGTLQVELEDKRDITMASQVQENGSCIINGDELLQQSKFEQQQSSAPKPPLHKELQIKSLLEDIQERDQVIQEMRDEIIALKEIEKETPSHEADKVRLRYLEGIIKDLEQKLATSKGTNPNTERFGSLAFVDVIGKDFFGNPINDKIDDVDDIDFFSESFDDCKSKPNGRLYEEIKNLEDRLKESERSRMSMKEEMKQLRARFDS